MRRKNTHTSRKWFVVPCKYIKERCKCDRGSFSNIFCWFLCAVNRDEDFTSVNCFQPNLFYILHCTPLVYVFMNLFLNVFFCVVYLSKLWVIIRNWQVLIVRKLENKVVLNEHFNIAKWSRTIMDHKITVCNSELSPVW